MANCRFSRGFTMIEVTLVLAITGLMLIGILATVSNRVSAQRYNDTLQSAEEFLRSVYSEVINVENGRDDVAFNQSYCTGPVQAKTLTNNSSAGVIDNGASTHAGRSTCAIYGKLVTFGEGNSTTARVYTVIGQLTSSDIEDSISSVFDSLRVVGADVYAFDYGVSTTQCVVTSAGTTSTYTPLWDGTLEAADSHDLFKGAVLIVRSPISGAVHTYRLKSGNAIEVSNRFDSAFSCSATNIINNSNNIQAVSYHLSNNNFEVGDVDICVNSPDLSAAGGARRDLRILSDGRNASAIKYVEVDSEDNKCAGV